MSEDSQSTGLQLPSLGLAEDLIPLLRKKLGVTSTDTMPPSPSSPWRTQSPILQFADEVAGSLPSGSAELSTRWTQLVTFELDGDTYGLAIAGVREIVRVGPITRVPHAPAHVRGITNARGRLLPVFEVRSRFGLPPATITKDSRIVMVEMHSRILGLLVDRVSYVVKLPESAIEAPPQELVAGRAGFVVGVAPLGDQMVIVLDLASILRIGS